MVRISVLHAKNQRPRPKTVAYRPRTDRQTHTHTHTDGETDIQTQTYLTEAQGRKNRGTDGDRNRDLCNDVISPILIENLASKEI